MISSHGGEVKRILIIVNTLSTKKELRIKWNKVKLNWSMDKVSSIRESKLSIQWRKKPPQPRPQNQAQKFILNWKDKNERSINEGQYPFS